MLFAVCSNQIKTFDLVLHYLSKYEEVKEKRSSGRSSPPILGPRSIFYWDENGNNALHFAVMHNLQRMYTHILNTAKHIVRAEFKNALRDKMENGGNDEIIVVELVELRSNEPKVTWQTSWKRPEDSSKGKDSPKRTESSQPMGEDTGNYNKGLDETIAQVVRNRLVVALNKKMHSPMTLAAKKEVLQDEGDARKAIEEKNKVDLLTFLFGQVKEGGWQYGPISSSSMDLEGIHFEHDIFSFDGTPGTVQMHSVLEWCVKTRSAKCFLIDEAKRITNAVWEAWGYSHFITDFVMHMGLTLMLTLLTCLVNEDVDYTQPPPPDLMLSVRAENIIIPLTASFVLWIIYGDFIDIWCFWEKTINCKKSIRESSFLDTYR